MMIGLALVNPVYFLCMMVGAMAESPLSRLTWMVRFGAVGGASCLRFSLVGPSLKNEEMNEIETE